MLEGARLLDEALASDVSLEAVFVVAGTHDATVERARELGITTGRRSGLLVNPQYQDVEFVTGP